ncbi:hypothetical protein WJX75_004095 [Coccomyxa subellipsoidea]|uniref:Proteasome assembly chaperone 1 n=1 Tax=Coccomyxa subellipsoidea TaxID=248742 RepID=A0ABR2YNM2_9CHLO
MEDPLTGHYPSRSILDEEEELQAQEFSDEYSTPPLFKWSEKREGLVADGKLHVQLLVLTTSTSGRSLLTQCLSHDQAIGRIIQPEILQEAPIALRAMVEGPTGKESACECFVMAVISYCQVHDVPATLLVSVDASPLPDGVAVKALAENVARLLEDTEAQELSEMLKQPQIVAEACREARKNIRLSDRAALYL